LLGFVGWAVLVWGATLVRIDAREALLASEFGAPYQAHRARTWRLIPGVD
jgi:protein-S-isoprenylcysteine O-methyltransferase Ste14